MPATCGGVCACRSVPDTELGTAVMLYSSSGHTLRRAASATEGVGGVAATLGRTVTLRAHDLDAVLAAVSESLSVTERREARALVLPPGGLEDSWVELALAAPTLAQLVARRRYAPIAAMFADPSRFHARFQPIVELGTERVVAHESLLRARADDGSELGAPALFGGAEDAGWTHILDRVGRETAIRDAASWLGEDDLFINFVPTSIYRPELCLQTTLRAAERHGVRLDQLVFEVVETDRVDDVQHLIDIATYYRERGARIALDDVGSGYASLELVTQVRPDVIKIDRSIVSQLPSPTATAIVRALVSIAAETEATVLAEGVETREEADAAGSLGVQLGQGWLFGRPERRSVTAATSAAGSVSAS